MTRLPSSVGSFSTVSISLAAMRPTGMPVQSPTTLATAWKSTVGSISGLSPCSVVELVLHAAQLGHDVGALAVGAASALASAALSALASSALPVPSTGCSVAAQLARAAPAGGRPATSRRSSAWSSAARRSFSATSSALTLSSRSARRDADRALARDDADLGLQRLDAALRVVDLGRHRVQADGHARGRGVEQAHRLVRQLARRDVAVRQLDRGLERLVEDLHLVVLLHRAGDAAHHQDGLLLARLVDLDVLEAARQRRILLDVLLVLGPGGGADGAQLAARERRLEQVGRVAGAGRAAGAHQRVRLVDEQDDGLGAGLHLVDDRAQALLELALHAGAGLQQADVQRQQRDVLQAAAARRRARCAARSLRPPPSCRRRPRRPGSGCSGGGASGCRRPGGSRRRGRRSDPSCRCAPAR